MTKTFDGLKPIRVLLVDDSYLVRTQAAHHG